MSVSQKVKSWFSAPVAILLGAVVIAGAILYSGSGNQGAVVAPTDEPTPVVIQDPSTLLGLHDATLGNDDAPVTIVEFSDFQCPFCRVFYNNTFTQLKENYVDTGKVKLVYRNFPLSFHPMAAPSALAALCAKDQGKFWEMHDILFEEQEKLGSGVTVTFDQDDITAWAKKIGLDMQKFNQCVESDTYSDQITDDVNAGIAAGVDGTPSFFVNGTLLVGAQPYSVFEQAIEAELSK